MQDTGMSRSAAEWVEELRLGNDRFVRNEKRLLPIPSELRRTLAQKTNTPIATIVVCPDCRVPVDDMFCQPPGRLFVVHAIGNTATTHSIGAVQYAVAHLHSPVLVVLGHTQCAAVKACTGKSREEGCLDRCYDPIRQATVRLDRPLESYRDPVQALTIANVRHAADSFLQTNPLLARKVGKRQIVLVEGVYDTATGVVGWLE